MEKELLQIQHLLSQVSAINKKYEQIAEITGENFNVFKILGLTTNEVRTHSAFIAELLDPKGSHGCKDAFLKLFVKNNFDDIEFNTLTAKAEVEKHIGLIPTDYTDGGFIDILVTDDLNRKIIIENKIYAGDQPKQMYRYYKYGEKGSKPYRLFYLTLHGKEPSDDSLNGIINFKCISYKKDILEWLEDCLKEAVSKPIIRETLIQYINLIKHLTNKTTFENMKEEIKKIIAENRELIDSIDICTEVVQEAINEARNKFEELLNSEFHQTEIYSDNGVSIIVYWDEDNDGVFFGYRALKNGENISNSDIGLKYRHIFKKIDNTINSNHVHIAWYNPAPFNRYEKFESLDKKEIFRMNIDENYLKEFVLKIVSYENEIRKKFLEEVERV